MGLFDLLPPQPPRRRVALGVTAIVLVRAMLVTVYETLDDLEQGVRDTLGAHLIDEFTGATMALPLLALLASGVSRRPLRRGVWLEHTPAVAVLFISYSAAHTVGMELLRHLLRPLVQLDSVLNAPLLLLAIGRELPNDLFYVALVIASVELWQFWWHATENQRIAAERQRHFVEAQLTALRLQLQPHFLFNALNTVSATMYDDPRRADTMLGDLAELLRASLRRPHNDLVPLREELAIADRYIDLQTARFGNRLSVHRDIEDSCLGVPVPLFLLQPLLENAVRHGRVERLGSGRIVVSARYTGTLLVLDVWDDGGDEANASAGHGLGLRATRERLQLQFGERATLSSGPAEGGWRVRISLPVECAAS
jgi:hypothetical protein